MIKKEEFFIKNSKGKNLCCEYFNNKSNYILIYSHGFTSTKERGMSEDLKILLKENQIDFFRFDYSGCGKSSEEILTCQTHYNDLKEVIKYIVKNYKDKKIILCGNSLGGLTSLKNYSDKVQIFILFAPVTNKIKSINEYIEKKYSKKNLEYLNKKKYFNKVLDDGKIVMISEKFFKELSKVNQSEFFNISASILIIHGDKDMVVDIEDSINFSKNNKNVELKILKNGLHSYLKNSKENQNLTIKYIEDFLHKNIIIK